MEKADVDPTAGRQMPADTCIESTAGQASDSNEKLEDLDENRAAWGIFDHILDCLIAEEVFNLHYAVRMGYLSLEELFGIPDLPQQAFSSSSMKQGKNASAGPGIPVVTCPCCHMPVSGNRFAPHLEKCLNGGKRAARAATFLEVPRVVEKKVKVQPVDPYPTSLIVRVKLKSNIPKQHQQRMGATLEEFNETKRLYEEAFGTPPVM